MLVVYFIFIICFLSICSSVIYRNFFKKDVIDEFMETIAVSLIANSMGFGMMYVMLYKLQTFNQVIISFLFSLIYSLIFLKFYTYTDLMD